MSLPCGLNGYVESPLGVEPEPEPEPEPKPDAAGIIRYIAQQRATGHQMTVWDNVGGEDNPIELSDSDDEL